MTELHIVIVLADNPRALWHEQNAPCRAVVDVFGHLSGDLARKVGSDAGYESCCDNCAGLKDIWRRWSNDAIGRHRPSIGRCVQESVLTLLCGGGGRRRCEAEARQIRGGRECWGSSRCSGSAPAFRSGKQTAGACGLDFLKAALLFRADTGVGRGDTGCGHGLSAILGAEDRPAEVTGKGRTELRHATVISRQAGQAVSRRAIFGRIEFVVGPTGVARLQRVEQCTAEADAGDKTKAGEDLAR
ncbi:Uncharacterised protein [Roseomonas mucosa]|uniref:Uncharacterized protein n=1 Tax=Roseomonas mucosa TaxID=207340 RepID=A0A379MWF2_9PROT|nr:Uncharacterised protein [Roseomonas mucosa]